jgi:HD superfamily phosphohydrolase YqeK
MGDDVTVADLHPLVEAAGREATLPRWARCEADRRAHCVRVGDLLASWARDLGLSERDVLRWQATGVLHDALKDADPAELQKLLNREWPPAVVHAPACAARLEAAGVADRSLLDAIAYHPVGHPDLDDLGRCLILADYLDPGREFRDDERARLRSRLPEQRREVLVEVLARRMEKLLAKERSLLPCTVNMWNEVIER